MNNFVHIAALATWKAFNPRLLRVCGLVCCLSNDVHCHHTHLQEHWVHAELRHLHTPNHPRTWLKGLRWLMWFWWKRSLIN